MDALAADGGRYPLAQARAAALGGTDRPIPTSNMSPSATAKDYFRIARSNLHTTVGAAGRPRQCQNRPISIAAAFALLPRQLLLRASSVFSVFQGGSAP